MASARADPAWGSSPEERASRLARAVKVAGVISVVGYFAALVGIFFPRPFALWIIVLTLAPPAFFIWTLACRGRWSIGSTNEDPRPQVGDAVRILALALGLRGLLDTHIYDLQLLLATCALIAIGAAFASYDIAKSGPRPRATIILVVVVTMIWAYGAISEANVWLDRGPPTATRVVSLIRKDVSRGKSTTYSLVTKSWRGGKSATSTDVPRALWDSLSVGDDVCIQDHQGALRLRWFQIDRCPSAPVRS